MKNTQPTAGTSSGKQEPDAYDAAVAYLTAHPEKIRHAWSEPSDVDQSPTALAHCLFQYLTPTGEDQTHPDGFCCGCVTMVAAGQRKVAWTPDLTEFVLGLGIATNVATLTVADLPKCAAVQRRADREFGRTPPARIEVTK